jgi:filamentous hemagglutinin family protein
MFFNKSPIICSKVFAKNKKYCLRELLNLISYSPIVLILNNSVNAQIIPDTSLNLENSSVTSSGTTDIITGGAVRGSNLFHSFQEFNINPQREGFFTNPTGIENIISRVTGKNSSQILGTLGVLGKANLFLINPNGIVFGKDASLAIQGSFFASTAESLIFDNSFEFSATNPQIPPLLTINIPIGLQMGENPGSIINQSQATNPFPLPPNFAQIPIPKNAGLQVLPGQILGLIGGDIIIENGALTASSGQIFLGSAASAGLVSFTPMLQGLNFNYDQIQHFGNISILNNSLINASGIGGGQVNIKGENITLDNSQIYSLSLGNLDGRSIDIQGQNFLVKPGSQISSFNLGEGKGSDINIQATDSVKITGLGSQGYQKSIINYATYGVINPFDPQFAFITTSSGNGNAGNISIDTNSLLLKDGVLAGSATFGAGNAGNIDIRANTFEMYGSAISNAKTRESIGKGGSINIETEKLTLQDESALTTLALGQGTGGNINIQANEFVKLLNSPSGAVLRNNISTTTLGVNAKAGDIAIETKRLIISGGAWINSSNGAIFGPKVFSSTSGVGGNLTIRANESIELFGISGVLKNRGLVPSAIAAQTTTSNRGGDIYISTPMLSVRDGGIISASSSGLGNAGNITIDANRIEVIGSENNGKLVSQIDVSVGSTGNLTSSNITGNAGSLNLHSQKLLLQDGGLLTVQALGTANAGNINIKAKEINLDNQAKIDAATGSGTGGNINLRTQDIFLRRGSKISTDAGSANGGNIDINSQFIVAVPQENSDITANAIEGNGGKINITATSIFGLQVNNQLTPKSDISASSEFGVNGTVKINTFNIEPTVVEQLSSDLVDTSNEINQTCSTQVKNNSFTVTGRGGIPLTPKEVFNVTPSWIDWRFYPSNNTVSEVKNFSSPPSDRSMQNSSLVKASLVEANALLLDNQGHIALVANSTTENSIFTAKECFR